MPFRNKFLIIATSPVQHVPNNSRGRLERDVFAPVAQSCCGARTRRRATDCLESYQLTLRLAYLAAGARAARRRRQQHQQRAISLSLSLSLSLWLYLLICASSTKPNASVACTAGGLFLLSPKKRHNPSKTRTTDCATTLSPHFNLQLQRNWARWLVTGPRGLWTNPHTTTVPSSNPSPLPSPPFRSLPSPPISA